MKRIATNLASAALGTAVLVASGSAWAQAFNPNNPTASGYTLVFNAQFNGSSLDTSKWSYGWAWTGTGLNTSTYPNDQAVPTNIVFKNGVANFEVTRAPSGAAEPYYTAVITSYGKFSQTYGYWETQVQMPTKADGIWPAFWLVPTNFSWPPEIDIMEWLGVTPNTDYMTLHYGSSGDPQQVGGSYTGSTFGSGSHKLGMLWTPTSITWYVDGVQRCQATTGIPSQPMYIILNIDTGGWNNNVINSTTVFPATMSVSYVHVYSAP
jgi:beta-glucanase (GH16 family)